MKLRPRTVTTDQRCAMENTIRAAFHALDSQQLRELVMEPYRDLQNRPPKKRERNAR